MWSIVIIINTSNTIVSPIVKLHCQMTDPSYFDNIIVCFIGFGARGAGKACAPHILAQGGQRGGGAHHFELQPLVCSGKVKMLTQQCITQVNRVTTNSQQDP